MALKRRAPGDSLFNCGGAMNGEYPQKLCVAGFSLIEILIVLAVFSILIGSILGLFSSQRDVYIREDLKLERDQNLRMALETISSALRTAGYCAADEAFIHDLSDWAPSEFIPSYPLSVDLDANPKITVGDGDLPDMITFVSSIPTATNPTTLSADSDDTKLTVSLSKSNADKQYRTGDIVYVGYLPESARVTAIDGKILTIDTDPGMSGLQPLSTVYPGGSPMGELSVVSYAVFNDENDPECKRHEHDRPLLKRKINAGGFYPVAENIERMKVRKLEGDILQISLTARTDRKHLMGGNSGRAIMSAEISFRNAETPGLATDCAKPAAPSALVVENGLDDAFPCCVLLTWDQVDIDSFGDDLADAGCPVIGYRIFHDVAEGIFGNHVDVSAEDASGYLLDVSGIPSSVYYISVAAENSGGFGESSSEVSITDDTPPERPSGLSAIDDGSAGVLLSWDGNPECDLAGYYIYRKKDGGAFEPVNVSLVGSGSDGYSDIGLGGGAAYTYVIEAVDFGFNRSAYSDEVTIAIP